MAAQAYYSGSSDFPPPPPSAMGSAPPPPYTPEPQPLKPILKPSSSPRPQQQQYHQPAPSHFSQPPQRPSPVPQQYSNNYTPTSKPHPVSQYAYRPSQYPPQQPQSSPYLHPQQRLYPPRQESYYRSASPSPHRHRHRHHSSESRSRSHPPERSRRGSDAHKARNTFLGAGSGAILADVFIGPGVGTLGGAILGGLGGNKYTKEKQRKKGHSHRGSGSSGGSYEGR